MKTTIIRALLFVLFYLLLHFVLKVEGDVLFAFIITWIIEPAVSEKI